MWVKNRMEVTAIIKKELPSAARTVRIYGMKARELRENLEEEFSR